MKLTREQLKGIVKELVKESITEILSEGLNASSNVKQQTQQIKEKRIVEDVPTVTEHFRQQEQHTQIDDIIQDPILRNILKHTEKTTYRQQQAQHAQESLTELSMPQQHNVEHTPASVVDQLPGSDKWANLAFSQKTNKR